MSIADKLQDLITAKEDIKTAIQNKGVTVDGGLTTYADAISKIPNNEGDVEVAIKWYDGWKLSCSTFTEAPMLDTTGVTDLSQLFNICRELQTVPLYDTSNVKDMKMMFYNCGNLQSVPLFDTTNVTDMMSMFAYCTSLETIPQFDTTNVKYMSDMFEGCTNLKTVPLLNTPNVYRGADIFSNCPNLENIGGLHDLGKDRLFTYIEFDGCPKITTESVSNIFNHLYDRSNKEEFYYNASIALPTSVLQNIPEYIITIAIKKGWQVVGIH